MGVARPPGTSRAGQNGGDTIWTGRLDRLRGRRRGDRKLATVRDTCAALYAEASGARTAVMEFAVLLLILAEFASALLRR